jgi:hypothetical protein
MSARFNRKAKEATYNSFRLEAKNLAAVFPDLAAIASEFFDIGWYL